MQRDMSVKDDVFQVLTKGALVLLLVAFSRVGRTYARRTEPDHVLMPGAEQLLLGRAHIGRRQFTRHPVDQLNVFSPSDGGAVYISPS